MKPIDHFYFVPSGYKSCSHFLKGARKINSKITLTTLLVLGLILPVFYVVLKVRDIDYLGSPVNKPIAEKYYNLTPASFASNESNFTESNVSNSKYFDKFGIKKIYPTRENGREWYINMENVTADKSFDTNAISLNKEPDGSWKLGSADSDDVYQGLYHTLMSANTSKDQKEWKNVEMTGYLRMLETSDDTSAVQFYARGGRHSDEVPCEGTSIKGRLHANGEVGWIKEIWHDGGYTEENATAEATDSILDRWVGFKVVIYNINNDSAVAMESYLDLDNNNHWKKVNDFIDNGGWYSSSSDSDFNRANCGKPKDYIVTNSGPIASFRSDGIEWDFRNLSVREIQPTPLNQ